MSLWALFHIAQRAGQCQRVILFIPAQEQSQIMLGTTKYLKGHKKIMRRFRFVINAYGQCETGASLIGNDGANRNGPQHNWGSCRPQSLQP